METNSSSYNAMPTARERSGEASFMQLLKSDFALNGGNYLKLAIAILGCFLALDVIICIFTIDELNTTTDGIAIVSPYDGSSAYKTWHGTIKAHGMGFIQFGCLVIISLGLTVLGSLTFSNMSSKRQRISTLMLPASISQKFWLRFLVHSVGGIILLTMGVLMSYLIAEITFQGAEYDTLWEGIAEIHSKERVGYLIYLAIACGVLWVYASCSIYALGSALWPKLSWLKTWVALTVAQWIISIALVCGIFNGLNIAKYLEEMMTDGPETELWIIFALLILFNAGCWALAYWRFRNTQIVQTFMKK